MSVEKEPNETGILAQSREGNRKLGLIGRSYQLLRLAPLFPRTNPRAVPFSADIAVLRV